MKVMLLFVDELLSLLFYFKKATIRNAISLPGAGFDGAAGGATTLLIFEQSVKREFK